MMPITTSEVCARATIGSSAAVVVAPSNTFRRVIVIAASFVGQTAIDEAIEDDGKASKCSKSCPLKHSQLLVAQVRHQHQSGGMRDRERQFCGRNHRLRGH